MFKLLKLVKSLYFQNSLYVETKYIWSQKEDIYGLGQQGYKNILNKHKRIHYAILPAAILNRNTKGDIFTLEIPINLNYYQNVEDSFVEQKTPACFQSKILNGYTCNFPTPMTYMLIRQSFLK